jgi:CDP-diacylglycerol--glycerol-3-phosphate 3-phosphatidyltransferase
MIATDATNLALPRGGALRRALSTGPNLVTLSRLALLGLALAGFSLGQVKVALLLGALAGATDYLDGWWARRTGQVTRLGEILDQFCDVVLEVTLLLMAISLQLLPLWVLLPQILREVWVQCLRRSSIELGQNIPSRLSGKLKAAFMGWSCLPLFLGGLGGAGAASPTLLLVGQVGIAVGVGLTVLSGLQYTAAWVAIYDRA